jgi:predicted RNase H-like nuclease (RuvC/YqgF family)
LENKDNLDTVKSTFEDDALSQITLLENKLSTSQSTIEELEEKLNNYKQQLNTLKPNLVDER